MSKSGYNFFEIEEEIRSLWDQNKVFETEFNDKPIFSIDTPPPTVSGNLHIGHVFSYIHPDIIARFKRMCGYEVFYPYGFDNNGHATERLVENTKNISAHSIGRESFIKECLDLTQEVQRNFVSLWDKIGLSIDKRCWYSTIDKDVQRISQKSFIDLYKKGFVYRKYEPSLYCTASKTTIAQADLEEIEKDTLFSTISFSILGEENEKILIATTRPEMLAACQAIFFNPNDLRYKKLENKKAIVPIYNIEVPILADDKVVIEKGSGLVMCCTFGDALDVLWFKKYNLNYVQVIGNNGKMLENTGVLSGLSVLQAREKILEELKNKNFINEQKKIVHAVSVYERSKKEVEYLMLPQWFISVLPHKEKFIELADKIKWHPENMKNRYIDWVENLKWDWCISRQRFNGIPFPVWYDENQNIILADESDLPVNPLVDSPKDKNIKVVGDSDVMDTWNTSALTPQIGRFLYEKFVGENSNFIPMNIRPQAHDIIRTWAFDTIVKAWMHEKNIPWRDILISGHVQTKSKEKISKSKGNNPCDPEVLLSNSPADAIRYWSASAKLGIDTAFSEDQIKQGNRLIIKLFNAAILVEQFFYNFNKKEKDEKFEVKQSVNIWILNKIFNLYERYFTLFSQYNFSHALTELEQFFWADFCDYYLEIIKKQCSENDDENENIIETKYVLNSLFKVILQLFAPFLVYITEHLYQKIYIRNSEKFISLHKTRFINLEKKFNFDNKKMFDFDICIKFIEIIRKLKSENSLSIKAPINQVIVFANEYIGEQIKNSEKLLLDCCYIENLKFEISSKCEDRELSFKLIKEEDKIKIEIYL
jgi:valyl-tRNA synthetase